MKKVVFIKLTKKAAIVAEYMERTMLGETTMRSTGRMGMLTLSDKQYKAASKLKKGDVLDITISDAPVIHKDTKQPLTNLYWAY